MPMPIAASRTPEGLPVPVERADVVAYLTFFEFQALDPDEWAEGFEGIPEMTIRVTRNEKIASATYYEIVSALYSRGSKEPFLKWTTMRPLATMRLHLHDLVQREMGMEAYRKHFKGTPFAHYGGLPGTGTTARLDAWCKMCGICASLGLIRPLAMADILRVLDAPAGTDRVASQPTRSVAVDTRHELDLDFEEIDEVDSAKTAPKGAGEINLQIQHKSGEPLISFSVEVSATGAAVREALGQYLGPGERIEALLCADDTVFHGTQSAGSLRLDASRACVLRVVICAAAASEPRDRATEDRSTGYMEDVDELESYSPCSNYGYEVRSSAHEHSEAGPVAALESAEEQDRLKAAEAARLKAAEEVYRKAEEEAWLKAEEERRQEAEEEARLKAEEETNLKAKEEPRQLNAEQDEQLRAEGNQLKAEHEEEEEVRLQAEEEVRLKAEEQVRLKAEEDVRLKAEDDARRREEEEVQLKVDEEVRLKAQEEAHLKADQEERLKHEEKVRLKAEEAARVKADEEAQLKLEEEVRLKAEEEVRLKIDEETRLQAEEDTRLKTEVKEEQAEETNASLSNSQAETSTHETNGSQADGANVNEAARAPEIQEIREGRLDACADEVSELQRRLEEKRRLAELHNGEDIADVCRPNQSKESMPGAHPALAAKLEARRRQVEGEQQQHDADDGQAAFVAPVSIASASDSHVEATGYNEQQQPIADDEPRVVAPEPATIAGQDDKETYETAEASPPPPPAAVCFDDAQPAASEEAVSGVRMPAIRPSDETAEQERNAGGEQDRETGNESGDSI